MTGGDADRRWDGVLVLVTGGLGFIGSNLARYLVDRGADVLLVDSLIPEYGGNRFNLAGIEERLRVNISDLRDVHALRHLVAGRHVIFNLAGQTSHLDSMREPLTDLEINCAAQLNLLEACRRHNPAARIVFASTRQVYGRPAYLPVDEAHPLRPTDVNGIHKVAGETYHLLYHQVYGIETVALRLTNTYGPRMRVKDARQTFLGVWIRAAVEGRPFEVWGGEQLRDFSYVDDAVAALALASVTPAVTGGVYNVGGDEVVSLGDLADAVVRAAGDAAYEVRPFPEERRRIDIGDYYADDHAFRAATGWAPRIGLADGLARTIAYYRAHLAHYV